MINLSSFCKEAFLWPYSAFRPKHALKNLLIFMPLITMEKAIMTDAQLLWSMVVAFLSITFFQFAVYMINDIQDLESDRLHPVKSKRAIASGLISIKQALFLSFSFACIGLCLAVYLPTVFLYFGVYFIMYFFYSFIFKKIPFLDILALSSFFSLRIAVGFYLVDPSQIPFDLIAFCTICFLLLGYEKRYNESKISPSFRFLSHSWMFDNSFRFSLFVSATVLCVTSALFLELGVMVCASIVCFFWSLYHSNIDSEDMVSAIVSNLRIPFSFAIMSLTILS